MSEPAREIPGATAWERAVNLAGLLAERGVRSVEVISQGRTRRLLARQTDLVGEVMRICESGGGELRAEGISATITPGAVLTHG